MIESLERNQVFVFGSNANGFHGAGTAGYAFRDDVRNNWRDDKQFLKALKSQNKEDKIGKWAILGKSKGFQQGKEGKSYAIVTIKKPGHKRSVSLKEIYNQLVSLHNFALYHPEYEFLITDIGSGHAGYSKGEIDKLWNDLFSVHGKLGNLIFINNNENNL